MSAGDVSAAGPDVPNGHSGPAVNPNDITDEESDGPDASSTPPQEGVPAGGDETGPEAHPAGSDSGPVLEQPEQDGTGVDRPAPAPGPTFDEVLDEHAPDPDPHRRWRAAFLKGVRQSYALAEFADDDIVANGNDLCFEELINLRDFLDDKLRRVQELRLKNLPDNVREFRRPA
jgi:hypothetical protein